MSIVAELPYLKTLLTKDTSNHSEIMEQIHNRRVLDRPGYGWGISSGCDSQGCIVHYIPERRYYVFMHGIVGSDDHCCHTSTGVLLSRATIYAAPAELTEAVGMYLNRWVQEDELGRCDANESLAELTQWSVDIIVTSSSAASAESLPSA